MTRRLPSLMVMLALVVAAAAGGAAASVDSEQFQVITVRHRPTGFSIRVPEGFKLQFRSGVYVLRKGATSVSFSRLATTVTPAQLGTALMQALGGRVLVRAGDNRHFVAAVAGGSRNDHFVVERIGSSLAVTASTTSSGAPVALEVLRQMGLSARGGVALRPPTAKRQQAIPLRPYRAPDGGATALVPAGNDWDIQSTQGAIQGSSPRGYFVFGFSLNIPVSSPGPTPTSLIVGPYMNAVQALVQLVPRISPSVRNIRVRRILRDGILPTFTSSGMIQFDYVSPNGKRWTGVATVGTDDPSKYSNFLWNFYYSSIHVPVGSNPAVGVGLLRSWRSWDPSGAIAARTRAAIALINETNEIWQQTSEFRSQTADRQSRDVGCLLQGYYIVEDNSRRYNLPPLPCGQIYTERD